MASPSKSVSVLNVWRIQEVKTYALRFTVSVNTYCSFRKALSKLNSRRKLEVMGITPSSKPDSLGPKMQPFLPMDGNPGKIK